jgi:hypothetical protein
MLKIRPFSADFEEQKMPKKEKKKNLSSNSKIFLDKNKFFF